MRLYFLGGENIVQRDSRCVNQVAFNDAGPTPNILVLPWARTYFDKTYLCRKRLFDYFKSLGAENVSFAEYSDTHSVIRESMARSNLVYLTGGTTSILIERLKSKKIDDLLRRYLGVVVGRSAGALVLCKKCVLTGRKKSTKVIDGLGLVDFVVKAHYRPMRDKDNELKKFSESERIKVYAVPHGSAVSYRYGKLSFIGDVYLFEKGEKSQISSS